jgi:hypothetical protein
MEKWGVVVTLFYGLIVLALLVPATLLFISGSPPSVATIKEAYTDAIPWMCAAAVIVGEILLLWLSVDTTRRRLKPRTHILVSVVTTGFLMSILTIALVFAFGVSVRGDKFLPDSPGLAAVLSAFVIPWLIWGVLFYRFWRESNDPVTRAVAWLFRGSVLELLVAVPAQVIVRRRHQCSAPVVTGFGITSGIAIMLLSFGPSVLLLYKKRIEKYSMKPEGSTV